MTTAAALVRQRGDDDHRGLLFEGNQWSWRQVVAESEHRAALLTTLRRPGPFHVGVLLENTPEYLFFLAGAAMVGAVVVGINPTRRGAELAADITRTDCQVVVTDSRQRSLLDGLDLDVSPDRVLVVDDAEYEGRLAHVGDDARDAVTPVRPSAEDLYLLIFTSGSTGGPKAVRVTQGRAARSAARSTFTSSDVLYSAMPLFHGNALIAAVLPAFASGATIALRRRFSASGFLPDVRQNGATFFNSVGRAIAHIVATPPTAYDRDHHLRYVLGPETSAPDKAEFTRRFGIPVIEGYGSSENAIVLMPIADARPGTLGRANDEDDVAVVDSGSGQELPARSSTSSAGLPIRPRPSANWSGVVPARTSRGTTTTLMRMPSAPVTAGTGRETSPIGMTRASSTSPGGRRTGSGLTARTSPPPRSSGSLVAGPVCAASLCTRSRTVRPATR